MSDKRLFLLDGHALVYRAHFAFISRPLINSKGVNTSAVTGFTRTLWDLMQNEKPTHLAVVFDPTGPTFRHEMYAEYKANREEQPDDIRIAIPYIRRMLEAWHIPILSVENYEADDVIGTLAKQAEKEGYTVYMVTPDKDFGQLVSEKIFLYKPSRQGNGVEIMGKKEICEKWQIDRVDQVIDILALQGDSVDNIPGIPGIGPKTAAKLLAQFDSLEGLLENTAQLKGKQKEKVIEFADQGKMSKELATINVEVPIQFEAQLFNLDPPDREKLGVLFAELEFRTLARQILGGDEAEKEKDSNPGGQQATLFPEEKVEPSEAAIAKKHIGNTAHQYHLVDTDEKRKSLIHRLSQQERFCFDTETTSVDANQAELVGMSFCFNPGEAYYVPVPQDPKEAKALVAEFKSVLEDDRIQKIAQNLKYDALVLKWYGLEVKGDYLDTMIMHYLLEPELRHGMDYLAETYLGYKPISITSLIGKKGKKQMTMREVPVDKVTEYAAEDADITLQLNDFLVPKMEEEGLMPLYREMEAPLVKALVEMEYEGIRLDVDFLKAYSKDLKIEVAKIEGKIYDQAGTRFNIGSPKQVGEVLFDRMGLPYSGRKTKTGQYSTNEEKLADLSKEHSIAEDILHYRGLTKLISTYVDALPQMVNPRTGRVHSSFNQTIAATGRLSSNNPNLQNIPVRTPEGARVREAFIPRNEDYVLLAADYSQIELRLIAEISGDEAMLEAFQKGQDIHRATAARVFEVPYDEVSKEQRYRAKTVNFSIIYGAGATNLSRQLDIRRAEATELIEAYFKQYTGLKGYMENIVAEARKKGFVTTLKGRRRKLRDINSKSSLERSNSERMAINTPIQGSAADMIKIAMIHIQEAFAKEKFKSRMILQVHDELVFDAHKEELDRIQPIIERLMKNALPNLKVPILVEMGTGQNWREAH